MTRQFSDAELSALIAARDNVLYDKIPDATEKNVYGDIVMPGLRIFVKLQKEGLLDWTESDGVLSPDLFLTDEGISALQNIGKKA